MSELTLDLKLDRQQSDHVEHEVTNGSANGNGHVETGSQLKSVRLYGLTTGVVPTGMIIDRAIGKIGALQKELSDGHRYYRDDQREAVAKRIDREIGVVASLQEFLPAVERPPGSFRRLLETLLFENGPISEPDQ